MSVRIPFSKGHGTFNDFIVIPDADNTCDLDAEQVRWLCDRRGGLGADGVLRVVSQEASPEAASACGTARYFMDYRNADGSLAEMCGNGIRVFAHFLVVHGWETEQEFDVGTRAGCVRVKVVAPDMYAVRLRTPASPMDGSFEVAVGDSTWVGVGVNAPNPHVVALGVALEDLGGLDGSLRVSPMPASGVNVEFVELRGPGRIAMRVHERGVGETQSCGTGACAAAWVARTQEPKCREWDVEVPGGHLKVTVHEDDSFTLVGPADLVAEGFVTIP